MLENILIGTLVPLGICVILPVLIVWLVMKAKINGDNKRADVLIEAIRSNNEIDADRLAEALSKPKKTPRQILYNRLLWGCILTFVGIAMFICWIIEISTDEFKVSEELFLSLIFFSIGIAFLMVYYVGNKQLKETEEKDRIQSAEEIIAE